MNDSWRFDITPDTAVVTTSYIIEKGLPILYISHEFDEEEGVIWQFHAGNDDFSASVMRLVCLEEVLAKDPKISKIADLPVGSFATRKAFNAEWIIQRDEG